MLDPRSLSENREEIAESCKRRGLDVDLNAAITAQEHVAALQTELNELNHRRNEHQTSGKKKMPPEEREAHAAEGRQLKEQVASADERLAVAQKALEERMFEIPNLVHPDSPVGQEHNFNELRRVGTPRSFDFEPLDHLTLAERLDLLDFEAGSRVTGQKFYFLKNEAVLLELALQRFALETALSAGYTAYTTPDLARSEVVDGLAFCPRGPETQIYSIENTDLDLIGTAEITLGGIYADHVLDEASLPIRMAGISHCFRTEAGSAGRESKGLYRVHQFTKVEMFAIARPEESESIHQELLAIEEQIHSAFEIPFRVIDVATGDLGAPAYRKYDLEAWLPGRGEAGDFGEVTSTSNCTDFQSRRLKIRYRPEGAKRNQLVHTLNGTAVAVPRVLIALLENHQNADGSVSIPAALQPYTGFERIGPR
ncbi:serine--tRNA ligase [Myxococcota bacterium]|nr:serine--tRNA ligase [Myxococcota bacterium]